MSDFSWSIQIRDATEDASIETLIKDLEAALEKFLESLEDPKPRPFTDAYTPWRLINRGRPGVP